MQERCSRDPLQVGDTVILKDFGEYWALIGFSLTAISHRHYNCYTRDVPLSEARCGCVYEVYVYILSCMCVFCGDRVERALHMPK